MHDITAQFREFARGAPGGGGGLLHVFVPHTTAGVAVIELGAGSDAGLLAALSAWEPVVTKLHVYYCFELYHELDDLTVAFWLISPQSRELNCKGPPFKRRAYLAMTVCLGNNRNAHPVRDMSGVKKRERCPGMSEPEGKDDSSRPVDDGEAEFRETLRIVSHGFEGTAEKNVPRLHPFVSYFPRHLGPVLDVGCGVGLMIELLANAGATAVGIDLDSGRVAAAQSRGLRVVTADARDYLAGRSATFGGIFLRHIVEHFDGVEGVRLLHLCRKALRPGGVVVLITPNFEVPLVQGSIFWLDVTHRRPYPLALLRYIFLTLGLDIVESGCRQDEEEQDLFIVGRVPEGPVR